MQKLAKLVCQKLPMQLSLYLNLFPWIIKSKNLGRTPLCFEIYLAHLSCFISSIRQYIGTCYSICGSHKAKDLRNYYLSNYFLDQLTQHWLKLWKPLPLHLHIRGTWQECLCRCPPPLVPEPELTWSHHNSLRSWLSLIYRLLSRVTRTLPVTSIW